MKIWHANDAISMGAYSIAENLLFAILAQTPESEFLPFEKLFVALNSNRPCHAGYLNDVHMACGCFEKAKEAYAATDHQRKLGDLCWIQGDLTSAEGHYLTPKSGAQSYRTQLDHDRLIKLAFHQGQWDKVVQRFTGAPFSRGFSEGRVCCGNSETAASPFLEMLAIALLKLGQETPSTILEVLSSAFGLSPKSWNAFVSNPTLAQEATVGKIQKRCTPRPGKNPPVTVEQALHRGRTARSLDVLNYIEHCDDLLVEAQEHLERFGNTGDDTSLREFIGIVTRSGITAVSHSFLFSAMGHDSFAPSDASPERMARLYGSHPVMNKRHFGKLLQIKFEQRLPLTGCEIVTGLFQQMGSLSAILEPGSVQDFFGIGKLAYFRDWAEMRLTDWLSGRGAAMAEDVAGVWREGRPQPVRHAFGGETKRTPESPRNMAEWNELLNVAAKWLQARWKREIGSTAWVSENQLFQLLKRQLAGMRVQQHAQPTWISPQHLDVYVPEVAIAVEYMGLQHYEPVGFFGGDEGFGILQERDRKKSEACARHGVDLFLVKHDEDIGARAREIVGYARSKKDKLLQTHAAR
ncbi:MAG: hypothetical protein J0M04_06195 [Verrucomicrobia bacterium]|nr:hypothetical protein [Verrucomicrobiota bacterium]